MRLRTRSTSDLMLNRMGADAYRICSATEAADLCHRAARGQAKRSRGSVAEKRGAVGRVTGFLVGWMDHAGIEWKPDSAGNWDTVTRDDRAGAPLPLSSRDGARRVLWVRSRPVGRLPVRFPALPCRVHFQARTETDN